MKKMKISLLLGMLFTLVSSFCWAQEIRVTRIDPIPATFSLPVTITLLEEASMWSMVIGDQTFYNGDNRAFFGSGGWPLPPLQYQVTTKDGIVRTSGIEHMPTSVGEESYTFITYDSYIVRIYIKKTGTNAYSFYTVKVTCPSCIPMPPGGPIY